MLTHDAIVVARFAPDDWPTYRALRLQALADSPDAFASTLAAERDRPDAAWAQRLDHAARDARALPLVARVGDEAVGLAWARLGDAAPETAELFQVWVAPAHRGRGVARRLLDAAIAWARAAGARRLALDVTCGDTPAMRLYVRAGFEPAGEPEPLRPGSAVPVRPMRLSLHAGTEASPSPDAGASARADPTRPPRRVD